MANYLCVVSLLAVVVTVTQGCTSSSGRTPAWDTPGHWDWDNGNYTEIYPTFDPGPGALGVGITHRFKRGATDMPRNAVPDSDDVFRKLDLNGDGDIEVDEWVRHHGSVKNFVELLIDDDANDDETISKGEFNKLRLYYKTS
ncbi:uncharacterized protein [Ptychodera flava]|uniref:uncharacterized protein n=1 Tax=Ptychodera flava TaxID=63121 RepID=UPI00396A3949